MDQYVKLKGQGGDKEEWRLEDELGKDAVYHQFWSTCSMNTFPRKLLKSLDTSNLGRQVICAVKCGDYLVLLAKKKVVL
jgi:hypothetical protein